jgi:2-oxoglutarate ferredoxin oxidoreductase subunit beta
MVITKENLETGHEPEWCPGCGNFAILRALQTVLTDFDIPHEKYVLATGIGCHGKLFNYVNLNGFHCIHGRVLPFATGVKLSNHDLTVLGFAGDGDAFDEGFDHFPHAARRNVDIKFFVHNNRVYGLTTGQTSPTSEVGYKSKTTPQGSVALPINPVLMALSSDASFVARTFVGDLPHLIEIMKAAISHPGFAFVDILQVCYTFNKVNTYKFYRDRVYKLDQDGHNPQDWDQALKRSREWGNRIPIGIFYQKARPMYHSSMPQLNKDPLVRAEVMPGKLDDLIKEFE